MDRRQHIEEELEKDYGLLKQVEERLRCEDDPRRQRKLNADIKEIEQRISEREAELKSLEKDSSFELQKRIEEFEKQIQRIETKLRAFQGKPVEQSVIDRGDNVDYSKLGFFAQPPEKVE